MPQREPFDELERFLEGMTPGVEPVDGVAVDLKDEGDAFVAAVDFPGYAKEDISVSVDGRTVTLRAEREEESEVKDENYLKRERRRGRAKRTVTVPEPVDETAATATFDAGVLTVRLPKREEAGGTTIDVE